MKGYENLSEEIIASCLRLKKSGLLLGTWGNVSVRLPDGDILITPSRVAYEEMTADDMVVLSPGGEVLSGHRLPTSEREIHRGILNARADVGAVVHTHSPKAMAVCAREGGVPVISEEMCQVVGGEIPLTEKFVPSHDHVGLGRIAVSALTEANALLIRNHGPVCMGRTLADAELCCFVVEKSCGIYLDVLAAGQFNRVPERYVKAGRDYYLNQYVKT